MTIGVILHVDNPALDDAVQIALAAEDAGATWIGLPDAFWWRDTWMMALEVARATRRIAVGPLVTNPFMRHRFHTISALATLHEASDGRAMLGLGAGGSEITDAAGISRGGAGPAIADLVRGMRAAASGAPLHEPSKRHLSVPFTSAPRVIVAGRGRGVLRAAGAVADAALLWALPARELSAAVGTVRDAARARDAEPAVIWAPLVDHTGDAREQTAYAVVNSSQESHRAWGLDADAVAELRSIAVAEGNRVASRLVPGSIAKEIVVPGDDPNRAAQLAAGIGANEIAVRADSADGVGARVDWARRALLAAAADVTSAR
ncbi:LLM class flavin-dependent oxidoreductase [Ruicaihuangia caeni]|uniref:LLM class flavin-dependent oxidoreductase n=1 Tax=Ruicaihuangia caeni TaxID=3042517 RepID=A0AAW6T8E5_9MICO|nr:LLM class flavin-dependent oxidoreductase [Klugiella sp. YN-L-19]MDI2099376.1 LLM class flavin-dependent oxidoreductase [Klugiella sp. YN-L-19]